jgi:hypothetical protein
MEETKTKTNAEVAELQAIIEEQSARIKELEAQLEAALPKKKAPAVPVPTDTFTVNKQKYAFKVAIIIHPDWGRITAKDALVNKALLEDLVLRRSGAIKRV